MNSEFKLPSGRRELKIGDSLRNNGTSFHGIKYDFKPSNEECDEAAIMEVTPTNQVSLKYPRNESEGSSDFMYSGTMKQFPKEYFLVIDHVTGEVTLEKLTANIQLKRTKVANTANKNKNQNYKKPEIEKEHVPAEVNDDPSTSKKKAKRKQKSKSLTIPEQPILNKKYNLIPQHSPLHPSPSRTSPESKNQSSSSDCKPPSYRNSEACASQSSLNSVDDDESSMTGFESKFPTLPELLPQHQNEFGLRVDQDNIIGSNSDSTTDSSSDSDSNSDSSSSSSTSSVKKEQQTHVNGYLNGCNAAVKGQLLLKDDLRLSDSGSDTD